MKRVRRQPEPIQLTNYRHANPFCTWQQMRDDAMHDGPAAYEESRKKLIAGQGGICAFCEIDICDNDPLQCRVEHFHPKSDITQAHNWALDWNNLLAVCAGGSYRFASAPYVHEPLAENLSCDTHKNRMIQVGRLQEQCEGWILDPAAIPAFPSLFRLEMSTGRLLPDPDHCAVLPIWPGNRHADVPTLVQHTIDMLNLNCDRLCNARLTIIRDIERNKKKQRMAGFAAHQGLGNLAAHYLRQRWPGFFSTIRLCLGTAAETYLANLGYQG
ncbi:retron system putative HNH endonuclease [Candidatus Symbiobacter mobilis]|uniref:TIGR02646 family protein n=1 Tax=Candidatus Symbiobacter mobilis CR TaxID=946483 RepID=U5NBF1_9BURK|nr:retron system putative HNH endonuclease [Candidatus Symbiobacter mobilis]AGX88650.1 hypothetical protein Cenrod_2599 [Candidatus Symbiobacter mobilis CR]